MSELENGAGLSPAVHYSHPSKKPLGVSSSYPLGIFLTRFLSSHISISIAMSIFIYLSPLAFKCLPMRDSASL